MAVGTVLTKRSACGFKFGLRAGIFTHFTPRSRNRNNIHHVATILAGADGINTLSNQGPASEIQYNYLHDFGRSTWADYDVQGATSPCLAINASRSTMACSSKRRKSR